MTDRVGMGHVVPGTSFTAGTVALHETGGIGHIDHELDGVRKGEDEWAIRFEYSVYLAEHPAQIADGRQCVDRDDRIETIRRKERERGQLPVVEFDVHAGFLDRAPGACDLTGVLIDADDPCALPREGDRSPAGAAAEHEETLIGDVAQQPAIQTVDAPRAELEGVVSKSVAVHSGCGVASPRSHGRRV